MQSPFLMDERAYLRPYERDDAPRAMARITDHELTRRSRPPGRLPSSRSGVDSRVGLVHAGGARHRTKGRRGDRRRRLEGRRPPLSGGGPRDRDRGLEPAGRGIGTEATVCDCGFAALGLDRIELEAVADNTGGIRAWELAGFICEAVRRQARMRAGGPVDVALMSILRYEWHAKRGR
ncbi:MAG: GNAT family N-acetyltransferase [Thermoleophilia bacterium]|nr:GNAT family N-acetyltransferase [Thermoleophilia bacterium]